jgi:hypothetical protein
MDRESSCFGPVEQERHDQRNSPLVVLDVFLLQPWQRHEWQLQILQQQRREQYYCRYLVVPVVPAYFLDVAASPLLEPQRVVYSYCCDVLCALMLLSSWLALLLVGLLLVHVAVFLPEHR